MPHDCVKNSAFQYTFNIRCNFLSFPLYLAELFLIECAINSIHLNSADC